MLHKENQMDPIFEVIPCDALGVKGTQVEADIIEEKCILCGQGAKILVYVYKVTNSPLLARDLHNEYINKLVELERFIEENCVGKNLYPELKGKKK
jgi:hypothetical protein